MILVIKLSELKRQPALCKQISEKPAVDVEPTPFKESVKESTQSSQSSVPETVTETDPEIVTEIVSKTVPETVQTVLAKEDAPTLINLPIKLPIKPASCVLDTRRNLLRKLYTYFIQFNKIL